MAKPKTIYFSDYPSSGVNVTYFKSSNTLLIGGWYDSMVDINGGKITLADFFSRLGITEEACNCNAELKKARELLEQNHRRKGFDE